MSITMGDGEYPGRGTLSLTQERMSSRIHIPPEAAEPLARPTVMCISSRRSITLGCAPPTEVGSASEQQTAFLPGVAFAGNELTLRFCDDVVMPEAGPHRGEYYVKPSRLFELFEPRQIAGRNACSRAVSQNRYRILAQSFNQLKAYDARKTDVYADWVRDCAT